MGGCPAPQTCEDNECVCPAGTLKDELGCIVIETECFGGCGRGYECIDNACQCPAGLRDTGASCVEVHIDDPCQGEEPLHSLSSLVLFLMPGPSCPLAKGTRTDSASYHSFVTVMALAATLQNTKKAFGIGCEDDSDGDNAEEEEEDHD